LDFEICFFLQDFDCEEEIAAGHFTTVKLTGQLLIGLQCSVAVEGWGECLDFLILDLIA
jgi:hypothetical protein